MNNEDISRVRNYWKYCNDLENEINIFKTNMLIIKAFQANNIWLLNILLYAK